MLNFDKVDFRKKVGERIKKERIIKNCTITMLAKIVGVNKKTIKSWEEGKTSPKGSHLIKICKFFNKSCDYFLGLESNKKDLND